MLGFHWTDLFFLALIFLSIISIALSLRKNHHRQAYKYLLSRPLAVSSGIVCLFFMVVAILDSIHISWLPNQRVEIVKESTILDAILAPLGDFYEKTYSAPLALNLYTPQTILVAGSAQQVYPSLKYVKKFNSVDAQKSWIYKLLLTTFFKCILLIFFLILIFLVLKKARGKALKFSYSQISAFITLFLCLLVILCAYNLSRELHVLGTGKIGEDIFYYTIKSVRTGLVIGTLTTMFMMPLALLLGVTAGYFGGFIDDLIQYLYTVLSSIPGILLITAAVLSMQTFIANHPEYFTNLDQVADARLLSLCLILGITSWTSLCRLLRAETLKLREVDFVTAAKALGSSTFTIMRKHLIPNMVHIILITIVLDFSFLVLAEAVLSYVGVGVSPMTISWGNMINSARLELAREPIVWWPIFSAFTAMFILVLALNIFADAIRDAFDPREH